MDAAKAGLIGALGGALSGGLLTAVGAWIAARLGLKAARYQADKQAASTHEQWLRVIRRDTYAKYLNTAAEALTRMQLVASEAWLDGTDPRDPNGRSYMEREALQAIRKVEELTVVTQLEADPTMSTLVRDFQRDLAQFARQLAPPSTRSGGRLVLSPSHLHQVADTRWSEMVDYARKSVQGLESLSRS
ncbi:hypothetical protein [Streptomyces sp. bgisy031]|uniref:hypothetical protein n=1 Tax=Streptomyces sp. bgisy031 TaxID=3413772 RepID=UPI003D71BAF4